MIDVCGSLRRAATRLVELRHIAVMPPPGGNFFPPTDMPPVGPKPFFSLLDQALFEEVRKQIGRLFWIDGGGDCLKPGRKSAHQASSDAVMRVFALRARYASN